jgi:hypothetical protein
MTVWMGDPYLCAQRGYHISHGVGGCGTSETTTLLSDHCSTCGCRLGLSDEQRRLEVQG